MTNIGKTIFNLTRFQVLQTKLNPHLNRTLPDYYAHAWDVEMYPYLDSSPLHEDLKEYFTITEDQIDEIVKYAEREWRDQRLYTFYEYESHYGIRGNTTMEGITRWSLICVFRYLYLHNTFDEHFWGKLLEPTQYPIEAESILRDYEPPYFM